MEGKETLFAVSSGVNNTRIRLDVIRLVSDLSHLSD